MSTQPPSTNLPSLPPLAERLSKESLLLALTEVRQEVDQAFRALPLGQFFAQPEQGVWSPAQHLRHLALAAAPLVKSLRLPAFLLGLLFGRSASSKASSEVIGRYRDKLARGAKARGVYISREEERDRRNEENRERLLARWNRTAKDLIRVSGRLSESALDKYCLPHPLLGKLTLREMLTWTVYHNRHHLESVRQRLAAGSSSGDDTTQP